MMHKYLLSYYFNGSKTEFEVEAPDAVFALVDHAESAMQALCMHRQSAIEHGAISSNSRMPVVMADFERVSAELIYA